MVKKAELTKALSRLDRPRDKIIAGLDDKKGLEVVKHRSPSPRLMVLSSSTSRTATSTTATS